MTRTKKLRPVFLAFVLASLAIVANGRTSRAEFDPISCFTGVEDSEAFTSLEAMPPAIVAYLKKRMPNDKDMEGVPIMAPRGGEWQVTDVIAPGTRLPFRRFIQGGRIHNRYYLWYEQGGIGYSRAIAIFDLDKYATAPRLVILRHLAGTYDELCAMTRNLWDLQRDESGGLKDGYW